MSEKRLVDYVFLAGLPEDFDITLKETNLETPHNKPASSKSNDTISETQSNQNESNNTHTATSDDEESLRIADATLIESVRASIAKFDNERDEFLKSLRGARSSTSRNGSNESGKQRSSILPSASLFRNGSILSSKILKGLDERVSETDSLASSSRNTTNNHNTSSQPEQPLISHQTYLNVAPQVSPSKSQVQEACEHPLKQKFSPRLLARYPQIDYSKEEKFPAYIPMFCFPNDIVILESESAPPATYHGFVMTQEDGSKRYGVCLTTFEPLPNHLISQVEILHKKWCAENINSSKVEYANHLAEKIRDEKQRAKAARKKLEAQVAIINSDEREKIDWEIADAEEKLSLYNDLLQPIKSAIIETNKLWLPKCIGITSHLPWHDILRDWLCAVTMPMIEGLKGNKQTEDYLPLERYIVNLIHEIPLPPPGKLQIAISINDTTLFCGRPALNQTPIMRDFSLYPLFRSLSFKSILTLLEVVLAEGKILLISSYPDMLYLVAHSITYVMYPFSWQGVFIPILPARLMTCLQAPVPYIMGIQRQYKGTDLLPEDACIVDLDKDTIMIAQPPPQLPPRQRKKLLQSLEAYAPMHSHYSIPYGAPLYVQQAYPHGRFTPHCAKSKIIDNNKRITGVVAMPARAVPLAPSMNSFYDIDSPSSPVAFEPITRTTSLPGVEFRLHQRRMSNFSGSSSLFGSRDGSLKSEKTTSASSISDKSVKKKTNRFSTLSGAKSSIMSLRNKALNRTSLLALNQMNSGHAHKLSGDIISLPQPSNASQHDTASLFDDGWSVMVDPSERIPTEKDFVPREGHLMAEIPAEGNPDGQPSMKTWVLESLACGICQKSLGLNKVYKCEGCSMVAHDECLADITYPCTPACFDETKVHDAFLRVFASMLRNYRAYLTDGTINSGGQNSHEGSAFAINDEFFKKEQFLKSVERESKPFLSQLLDSQAFSYFVHERLTHPADPQILYFDEIITAKLNRSKLRISKEATLFLDDSSYAISQTLRATKPDDNGLSGVCYRRTRLPSSFDLDLISSPRPLQSLNAYL